MKTLFLLLKCHFHRRGELVFIGSFNVATCQLITGFLPPVKRLVDIAKVMSSTKVERTLSGLRTPSLYLLQLKLPLIDMLLGQVGRGLFYF